MFRPIWLRQLSSRLFLRSLTLPAHNSPSRRTRRAGRPVKPRLEGLEARVVPTTFEVVGNVTGSGQFLTLAAALGAASAGDTIQIEAGSHPGSGTVNANNLTIQADPLVGASGLQTSNARIDGVLLNGDNDTVTNVFADKIFLGKSATNTHISNNVYSSGGGVFAADLDNVTTTAAAAKASFSNTDQTIQLSATVTDTTHSSTVVNEGTVTFTVKDSGGHTIGASASGPVRNGMATTNFTLPGGTPLGTYTIGVSYSDSAGNFTDTRDVSADLTVASDDVTVTARPARVAFSNSDQTIHLSATVTDTTRSGTLVNGGIVTFTVTDFGGNTIGTAATGMVQNGTATADYTLPGGTSIGSYNITVSYTDLTGAFKDTHDVSAVLHVDSSVQPSNDNVTTTAENMAVAFSAVAQPVNLNASVLDTNNSNTLVNEGTVTFTVKDSQGHTIGAATTSSTVHNGVASAVYTLPAGQANGTYTISVHYSDTAATFTDTQDVNGTLTVHSGVPDEVSVTANSATVTFSTAAQPVTLTATVKDTTTSSGVVNEGTVTFTVKDGFGNTIGTAVNAPVQNGAASATYTVPAGQGAATYFITVHYTDAASNFTDTQDNAGTLTVRPMNGSADNVTTTANAVTAFFSPAAQKIQLSATVQDTTHTGTTVEEGTVAFEVVDFNGNAVGDVVTGPVSGGQASAVFTLPGGTAAAPYAIRVMYTDAKGNFTDTKDVAAQLSLNPAKVDTTATGAVLSFNLHDQTIAVSGTLSNSSHPDDPISEGTASFGILDGSGNIVGSLVEVPFDNIKPGPIHVNATLTVPGGTPAGNYAVVLALKDSSGNYIWNTFRGGPLFLATVPSTVQLAAASVAPESGTLFQAETLTAHVSGPFGAVTEGSVIFTVANQRYVADVDASGTASVTIRLPLLSAIGPQAVQLDYVDPTADFAHSGRVQTIQWNASDVLGDGAAGIATFGADGSQAVQTLAGGAPLFTQVFDAFGRLTAFNFGFFNLSFSYNAFGEMSQISFDGVPVLFFLYTAQGQLIGII